MNAREHKTNQIDRLTLERCDYEKEIDRLNSRILELEEALRPFAEMHRDTSSDSWIALKRGTGFDSTCLFERDFRKAEELLKEKK